VAANAGRPQAVALHREERDVRADTTSDGCHQWVIPVEHDPAVRLRDATDRRLDLGELGQGVDALQVEVIGRDVGEDGRVVGFVAHPAQHDPPSSGLEDADPDI
jgi:hypothetical protein